VLGDPGRLRQILVNLPQNAVKFTDEGQVELVVDCETTDEAEVTFRVTDTGIEISEADQVHLFEPFSQLDPSTTLRHGGTGLGPSIAHGLVNEMEGEIGVESNPGEGSTFWFTIGFEATDAPADPGEEGVDVLPRRRVLVVDGDPVNRLAIVRQLSTWGMVPRVAGASDQAIRWIQAGDPSDLALVDAHWAMPRRPAWSSASAISATSTVCRSWFSATSRRTRGMNECRDRWPGPCEPRHSTTLRSSYWRRSSPSLQASMPRSTRSTATCGCSWSKTV